MEGLERVKKKMWKEYKFYRSEIDQTKKEKILKDIKI